MFDELIEKLRIAIAGYRIFFDPMAEVYWVQGRDKYHPMTKTVGRVVVPLLRGTQSENFAGSYEVVHHLNPCIFIRYDLDSLPVSDYNYRAPSKPEWLELLESSEELIEWFKDHDVEMKPLPDEVYITLERDAEDWKLSQSIKKAYMK